MRILVLSLTVFLSLASITAADEVEVLELQSMGIPSPAKQFEARRLSDLFLFEGRLYLGTGDAVVNTGPAPVLALDPETGKVTTEFTVDDEAVYHYCLLDGQLAIPGPDATESWEFGNVYVRTGAGWVKHRSLPKAVHVNDLVSYRGGWFATTGNVLSLDDRTQMACGAILLSVDKGKTWRTEYLTASSAAVVYRVDSLVTFGGRLLAFPYAFTTYPEEKVPEEVRATAGSRELRNNRGYYTLYFADLQGAHESLFRTDNGWRMIDLIPDQYVCRVKPIQFKDKLLLSAVLGTKVAPFASYVIDKPIPVPGATYKMYAFDGRNSVQVPIEYDGLSDAIVRDGRLSMLMLKDGHYWIVETEDLESWNWRALPLDLGRPLSLERDGDTYYLGMRDGHLFRTTGTSRKVASVEEVSNLGVRSFEVCGELPRQARAYWAAITRWIRPGHPASASIEAVSRREIRIETKNVYSMRIFLPHGCRGGGELLLRIDGHEIRLEPGERESLDCSVTKATPWVVHPAEGSAKAYEPEPQVIGEAAEEFAKNDGSIADWVADALREKTGADIALATESGIKTVLPKGAVAMQTIHDLCYADKVKLFNMTGEEVLDLVKGNLLKGPKNRCRASGFTAVYDPETGVLSMCSLKPKRTYRVAIPGYPARKGERYFGKALGEGEEAGNLHTLLIEHLVRAKKVKRVESALKSPGGR